MHDASDRLNLPIAAGGGAHASRRIKAVRARLAMRHQRGARAREAQAGHDAARASEARLRRRSDIRGLNLGMHCEERENLNKYDVHACSEQPSTHRCTTRTNEIPKIALK